MSTLPPTTRADYPHVGSVSTRWNDNDRYGHVNNAVYYQYFDSVINEVLIHQGGLDIHRGEVVGFIVRSECDFLAPVAYPGLLEVGVVVRRLGRSSVTYETALLRPGEDQPAAIGRMVHVFVDTATGRPTDIPAPIRAVLERLLRPQPGG
ncbi:thioesterase family protein [Sphaerotilus sulfidivorans]